MMDNKFSVSESIGIVLGVVGPHQEEKWLKFVKKGSSRVVILVSFHADSIGIRLRAVYSMLPIFVVGTYLTITVWVCAWYLLIFFDDESIGIRRGLQRGHLHAGPHKELSG